MTSKKNCSKKRGGWKYKSPNRNVESPTDKDGKKHVHKLVNRPGYSKKIIRGG